MDLRGTILQPWTWHSPRFDQRGLGLWQRLAQDADKIGQAGYTAVWLPPASRAKDGEDDVGYAIRNWYELNGTKYGNREALEAACLALHRAGLAVYHDQVHNHLMDGEPEAGVWCLHVKKNNKNEPARPDCRWFQATIATQFPWLGFNHCHFDAYHPDEHQCWALAGKRFDCEAHQDPWGGCDLDFDSMDVVQGLEAFGDWYKYVVHVDGYRFDAVKHIRPKGTLNFLTAMRRSASRNMFAVGEFLHDDIELLHAYIQASLGQIALFDVPLQRKLETASQNGNRGDLARIFEHTLVKDQPTLAVTFVHSHDDHPPIHGQQHRGHYVGDWFISQAYALVLLRHQGYPMVADVDCLRHGDMIRRYMLLRTHCTFGDYQERLNHPNTLGWSFSGSYQYDNSMAVVLTNGDYGRKWLGTGRPRTRYRDFTDALPHTIVTNNEGWAEFECPSVNTSVWVEETKYAQMKSEL
jgi:alpha-amylase